MNFDLESSINVSLSLMFALLLLVYVLFAFSTGSALKNFLDGKGKDNRKR